MNEQSYSTLEQFVGNYLPIAVLSLELELLLANSAFYSFLDKKHHEVRGLLYLNFLPFEIKAELEKIAEKLSDNLVKPSFYTGEFFWLGDKTKKVKILVEKICDSKLKSNLLIQFLEEKQSVFFAEMPLAACVFNIKESFALKINLALALLLGYSKPLLLNQHDFSKMIDKHLQLSDKEEILSCLKTGKKVFKHPLTLIKTDDSELRLFISVVSSSFFANQLVSMEAYLEEEDLKDLKIQVKQEIINAKQAKDISNKSKNDFLANISHELRTPLNIIIGMSGVVLESPDLSADSKEYLEMVKYSGEELLGQINDLITAGELAAGRIIPNAGPFNVYIFLHSILEGISKDAYDKSVKIITDLSVDENLVLIADYHLIKLAVTQLLHNAVKFSLNGEVEIKMSLNKAILEQEVLQVKISDSGIGLPTKDFNLLFEDFSQADSSTTRSFGGLGVGLYLVRGIVNLLQGKLKAQNLEKGGAEFTLEIPIEKFNPLDY